MVSVNKIALLKTGLLALMFMIYTGLSLAQSTLDFYIPFPAVDLNTAQKSVAGTAVADINNYESYQISIVSNTNNTTFYYDHWEDGYDPFTGGTPDQASTETFTKNAGDVTLLESNDVNSLFTGNGGSLNTPCGSYAKYCPVPTNPRGTNIYYDGKDRVISNASLAITVNFWPLLLTNALPSTTPGYVMGGAAEVLPQISLGNEYEMPVGENVSINDLFQYAGLFVLVTQNNTTVSIDVNGDGDYDDTGLGELNGVIKNMGDNILIDGGIWAGATVSTDKGVLVHEYTGDIDARFETRVYLMWPKLKWSHTYYNPVGTRAADPTWVWIYNPHTTTLAVRVQTANTGITTINVAPGTVNTYVMAENDGAKIFSLDGRLFYAVTTTDSDISNTAFDWGFTLIPERNLTSEALVGFGDGSFGGGNASPIWVTAEGPTTIYVNWDGREADCDTPGNNDASYSVSAFASTKLFDTADNDQTGARIFTCDGTKLALAWGEDPALATTANDLDMGTVIIPIATGIEAIKTASLVTDNGVPGKADIGDVIEWTISIFNVGAAPVNGVLLVDAKPANTDYVANSGVWERDNPLTGVTSGTIPDETSGTAYPFDDDGLSNGIDDGYEVGFMAIDEQVNIKFRVTVTSLSNPAISNTASVTSNSGSAEVFAEAEIPVPVAPVANDDCDLTGNINTDLIIDVLANDADPYGDEISFDGFTSPSAHPTTITIAGQGTFTYSPFTKKVTFSPVTGFTGTVSQTTYRIIDTEGLTDLANICINYVAFDEYGCSPSQTWTATSRDYGDSQTNNGEVNNPANILHAPDNLHAELKKNGDPTLMGLITVHLPDVVAQGSVIYLYMGSRDDTDAAVKVSSSLAGSSFSNEQFIDVPNNANDGYVVYEYTVNQTAGVQYIRIIQNSEVKETWVDALVYDVYECVDNCVLPTVRVDIDGNAVSVYAQNATTNPAGALGIPDISASGGTWCKIDNDADYLILDLETQIPLGLTIDLYLSTDDGNAATVRIEGSNDGSTFTDLLSYNVIAGTKAGDGDVVVVPFTATSNTVRYLKFTRATGAGKPAIDGVAYDILECVEATPTANPDVVSVSACNSISINVQENDSDPLNNPLTTSIISGPSHGTAEVESNGNIAYSSDAGYSGSDQITYRVTNSFGLYDETTVTINVDSDPNNNCGANQTYVLLGKGYGAAIQSSTSVDKADAALGIPDLTASGNDAKLNNNADVFVVDLGVTIPQGKTVTIYHYTDNNFSTAGGTVTSSATTSGYTNSQNLTYVANDAMRVLTYTITQAAGARYFKFNHTGENIYIDGLEYDRGICVDDCSSPDFILVEHGHAVSQTNTGVTDPDFALGSPDHIGAKMDKNSADILTLNLGKVIPLGSIVRLYLAADGSGTATFTVTGSLSGTTGFSGSQAISVTDVIKPNYVEKSYTVTQTGGIQYIKLVVTNNDQNGWVDAIKYDVAQCTDATPIAVNDVATTGEDVPITVDVLANDTDPQGNQLIPTIVSGPNTGYAQVNANGTISFYPDPDDLTTAVLTYEICAVYCSTVCDQATLTITVVDDGCPPGERKSFVTGYATAQTNSSVDNAANALGEPTTGATGGDAKFNNATDYMTLTLDHTLPTGSVITIYHYADNTGSELSVSGSHTTSGFTNVQTLSISAVDTDTETTYTVTQANGVKYLYFTGRTAGNIYIDAVEYSGYYGPCEPYLQVSLNSSNTCAGSSNGAINLTATGGTTPYVFKWSNGATTEDISGLSAGTYSVTVTDANNDKRVKTATISEMANPTAIAGSNSPVCQYQDIDLTETGSGGTSWYWVGPGSFSSTEQNPSIIGAPMTAAGTYSVLVTNDDGCTDQSSTVVVVNPAPVCAISGNSTMCAYEESEIYSGPSTGISIYSWSVSGDASISGSSSGSTVSINAGSSDFTITLITENASGCTTECTKIITVNGLPVISTTLSQVKCNGGTDGAIVVSVVGGNSPYSFDWADGPTTQNRSGLSAGNYTVTVTGSSGCIAVKTVTITEPAAPLSVVSATTAITCSAPGAIDITVTGGTSPYTFDWDDLAGTNNVEDRTGLTAGTYDVTVTDANGCTALLSGPVTLTAPDCDPTANTVCLTDDASIFSVDPDPMVESYVWTVPTGATITSGENTAEIEVDFTGMAAGGVYEICVLSHNSCGDSQNTCIPIYVRAVEPVINVIPTCEGGDLQLSANGGVSYSWTGPGGFTSSSPNPVIYDVTSANDGTYTVTVVDEFGCIGSASVLVTVPTPPDAITAGTDALCGQNTGSIDLTPSGGSGTYSYLWSNAATSQDISSLYAGVYAVTVTDVVSGCTVTANQAISNLEVQVSVSLGTPVSCHGDSDGSIDLTVTTGIAPFTYTWSNGASSEDLVGVPAGTYNVTVTDATNCSGTGSITLEEPNPLQLDYTQVNLECNGDSDGSIDLMVSGGTVATNYTYSWTTADGSGLVAADEDQTGLTAGTYDVTVTDDNLCPISASISLTEPAASMLASTSVTHVSCNGADDGAVTLTVTGGSSPYTYVWSANANSATTKNISGLGAGTYTVTITDASGNCTTTATGVVNEPDVLDASAVPADVSCHGGSNGSIELTVTGGTTNYSYLWSNGATVEDPSGLIAGTYSVTITDANACTKTTSVVVGEPDLLYLTAVPTDVSCAGLTDGAIDLTTIGGTSTFTYDWAHITGTDDGDDLTGLAAGTYSVTVTDSKSCTASLVVEVGEPSRIDVSAAITNVDCFGGNSGSIVVTASGGTGTLTYNWSDIGLGTDTRTALSAGDYTVTVEDENGCTNIKTYTVAQSPELVLDMTETNISCNGGSDGSINLSVSGGVSPYSFQWDANAGNATTKDINGLSTGTYEVTVTDAKNCTASMVSDAITDPLVLTATVDETDALCLGGNDGSLTANPTGGTSPYSYSWSNGGTSQTISNLVAGTYDVTITDSKSCTYSTSATVNEPATQLELYATSINASACGGSTGSINLTVDNETSTLTFSWTKAGGGYSSSDEDPQNLAAGTYTVVVTDVTPGCMETLEVTVGTAPALSVTVTAYDRTCLAANGSVFAVVSGGVGPYSYLWSGPGNANGATTQSVTGLDVGNYNVTITDADNCTASSASPGVVGSPSCDPPVAQDDNYTTPFETEISGTVGGTNLTNPTGYDSDPDHLVTELEFLPLGAPTTEQGTIVWDPSYNGDFTYLPADDFVGSFSIDYQVCDPTGLCDIGTLTLTVTAAPEIVIVKSGPATGEVGDLITYNFSVTNDDTNGDGSPVSNLSVSDDIAGAATYLSGDTNANDKLDVGETWLYSVQYTILITDPDPLVNIATVSGEDGEGDPVSDTDTHSLNIHYPPVAVNDEDPTPNVPGTNGVVDAVTDNDTDPDNDLDVSTVSFDPTSVGGTCTTTDGQGNCVEVTVTNMGVWSVTETGVVTFVPDAAFNDDPTPIEYTVQDATGLTSNEATITMDYLPIASDDSSTGNTVGTAVTISVTDNDVTGDIVDPATVDLDETSISGASCVTTDGAGDCVEVSVPGEGIWTVHATTGAVTFTPAPNFTGDPTPIDYTVDDDEGNTSNKATITIDYDQQPAYTLEKTGATPGNQVDSKGDVITYTITLTNTGNTNLTGVSVNDPLITNLALTSGDTNNDNIMFVGEVWVYTGTYTVTQTDIDNNGGGDGDIDNTVESTTTEVPTPKTASYAVPLLCTPTEEVIDIQKN